MKIQMRRDTSANWTSLNPVLASGEWGVETDTGRKKLGDGLTAWNGLSYEAEVVNSLAGGETDKAPSVAAVNAALGDIEAALDAINGETASGEEPAS